MSGLPSFVPAVIVGAGPTGLTLANLLGTYGVETLIIDRNLGTVAHPRAIVLDDEGARTLQAVGLADTFLPNTVAGAGARYYGEGESLFAEVGPGSPEFGFPRRNFMYQHELEVVLAEGLSRFPNVTLAFGHTLKRFEDAGEGNDVRLVIEADGRAQTVRTRYLLACDGGRSPVREALAIPMQGSTYPDDWLIVDTANDPDGEPCSKFYCNAERPFVSIPAPRGGRRYEFMLRPGEDREGIAARESVAGLVGAIRPLKPDDIIRTAVYTFHARIAERFRDGSVFLLGDAAHLTPPFAGQGMNAGLRDAHNLAWKIAAVLDASADEALLDTYEEERKRPAWAMIQLAVAMGDVVMPKSETDIAFRSMAVAMLERFPEAKQYIVGMKFKPRPRYESGAFLDDGVADVPASLVGAMLPQPDLTLADGSSRRLDDVIGSRWALLGQSQAARDWLAQGHRIGSLDPARLVIGRGLGGAAGIVAAETQSAEHMRPIRAHRDQICLIRPDRYVAATFEPAEWASMADVIAKALHLTSGTV